MKFWKKSKKQQFQRFLIIVVDKNEDTVITIFCKENYSLDEVYKSFSAEEKKGIILHIFPFNKIIHGWYWKATPKLHWGYKLTDDNTEMDKAFLKKNMVE